MSREKRIGEVVLKNVRCSFPKYWKAESSVADGKKKYSGSFLIDPSTPDGKRNIKACEAAIEAVVEASPVWKGKTPKIRDPKRMAFIEGDECTAESTGEPYNGYEGMMVVKASNERRFPVVDKDKTPLTEEDGKPYAGCYVNAVVRFFGVSGADKGGAGIFASLEAVQFSRDGEAFGAEPVDVDDYFDSIDGDDDGFDGGDDDDLL